MSFVYGCSLDFTVRPDPGEGGASIDGGPEGALSDALPPDADATTAADAPLPDAACTVLGDEVLKKRTKARECAFAIGECQALVKDECGCDVVVSFRDAGRTSDYEAAIKSFLEAGCKGACGACKPNPNRNCLSGAGGTLCYEPP